MSHILRGSFSASCRRKHTHKPATTTDNGGPTQDQEWRVIYWSQLYKQTLYSARATCTERKRTNFFSRLFFSFSPHSLLMLFGPRRNISVTTWEHQRRKEGTITQNRPPTGPPALRGGRNLSPPHPTTHCWHNLLTSRVEKGTFWKDKRFYRIQIVTLQDFNTCASIHGNVSPHQFHESADFHT